MLNGELEYYQFNFVELTHAVQILIRMDVGAVDLYISNSRVPIPSMVRAIIRAPLYRENPHRSRYSYSSPRSRRQDSTYQFFHAGVTDFYLKEVGFDLLQGATSLFVAVRGASPAPLGFARYEVCIHTP